MKPNLIHCGLAALASMAALGGALAQTAAPDIDIEAIRARAASNTGEADALAASARERAKAVTAEAAQNAEGAKANGRRYAGAAPRSGTDDTNFDFDKMVADAGDMAMQGMGEAPRFIAFASLSMPADSLRQMMDDVTRAGGVVVFRGLTQGSAKVMTDALGKVLKPGERMDGVGIDPRLFRAFGVSEVPAYVVAASDFDLCSGFDCTSEVPPFDRMTGNVTARFALETFSEGGGPGARIARQHLARLERQDP
ncbi:type-F conjugative transfer system pilin assembly protein TrbC [Novosphingobium aquiterrae]|uniref:Type-F conjugative transfer system pilin assembly protein TrbC n=1 Tax=Novosphingobium aquiterrae TaxID=624388 RepID=A0ABV6PHV6_9SPHN